MKIIRKFISLFAKNEQENLSKAERNELKKKIEILENVCRGISMSKTFDILSSALDEATENSKAGEKFLREETITIEIEPLVEYTAADIKEIRSKTGLTQSLFVPFIGSGMFFTHISTLR